MKQFKVRQERSLAGRPKTQRLAMNGLGLRKIGHEVVLKDTPAIRGLITKVSHLVSVEVVSA